MHNNFGLLEYSYVNIGGVFLPNSEIYIKVSKWSNLEHLMNCYWTLLLTNFACLDYYLWVYIRGKKKIFTQGRFHLKLILHMIKIVLTHSHGGQSCMSILKCYYCNNPLIVKVQKHHIYYSYILHTVRVPACKIAFCLRPSSTFTVDVIFQLGKVFIQVLIDMLHQHWESWLLTLRKTQGLKRI